MSDCDLNTESPHIAMSAPARYGKSPGKFLRLVPPDGDYYANVLDEELVQTVTALCAECAHCHQPVRREHGGVWCHVFAFDMFMCPGVPEPEAAS